MIAKSTTDFNETEMTLLTAAIISFRMIAAKPTPLTRRNHSGLIRFLFLDGLSILMASPPLTAGFSFR